MDRRGVERKRAREGTDRDQEDGAIIGNLTTAQIMIEDGADFKSSIEIDRSASEQAEKNVASRAAAAGPGGERHLTILHGGLGSTCRVR
jgi:hypothetical protein